MTAHRRDFLKSSVAGSMLVALGSASIPTFLGRSAQAARSAPSGDRVLVIVQMLGGNDGLNTVVPFAHDGYTRNRRALRLNAGSLPKINAEFGLHPAMGQMAKLLEDGRLTVVQGVGYPNPDRS